MTPDPRDAPAHVSAAPADEPAVARRLPPGARRELILAGSALLTGVLLVPLLIWLVGNHFLGPYTHGQNLHAGPLALLGDFLVGLAHGSAVFWAVALGPLVLLVLGRLLIGVVRASGAGRGEDHFGQ